jgi:hypothetical protein
MKHLVKIFFIVLFFSIASKARSAESITNPGEKTGGNNDTTTDLKSNILIFKMINPPSPNSNKGGGLKKAGKVARTSYEHFTIDTLILQKKPI